MGNGIFVQGTFMTQAIVQEKPRAFGSGTLRIGAIPFLNAQPLLWGLGERHALYQAAPAEIPSLLKEGRLDVALAPVTTLFEHPELPVVPVGAIGCRGPVKSVRLLHHLDPRHVLRVFADRRSRTSVLLLKLLLRRIYGNRKATFRPVDVEDFRTDQLKPWEACLQIGDTALPDARFGLRVLDLGREWWNHVKKPFTFALWVARDREVARRVESELAAALEEGRKHLSEIVAAYPRIVHFDEPKYVEYLQKNVSYEWGTEEADGVLAFRRMLEEEGLLPLPADWPLPRRVLARFGVHFDPLG